jgi:hypothetical protein
MGANGRGGAEPLNTGDKVRNLDLCRRLRPMISQMTERAELELMIRQRAIVKVTT